MNKLELAVEVLIALSRRGKRFVSTRELFDELSLKGILSSSPEKIRGERRRLQRVLNDLHALGYIERKFSDFRDFAARRRRH